MKKHILFCLLLALGLPAMAQAACTEEELNFKKDEALYFRMHALQGQGKLTEYMQLGSEVVRDFSTLYASYQSDKSKGQAYLDRMCAIADRIIVLADDLLAGGDGLGRSSPWMSHKPETLLQAAAQFREYCKTPEICDSGEGRKIRKKLDELPELLVGGADPRKLVDETYERIQKFLPKEGGETSAASQ